MAHFQPTLTTKTDIYVDSDSNGYSYILNASFSPGGNVASCYAE